MQEHRHHPRVRSFLRGEIVHSGGAIRVECTIRDLSEEGARLQIPRSVPLPDPFDLDVAQRHLHERCTIIWRHGDEVGVQFHSTKATNAAESAVAPPATTANDRAVNARIEALEADVIQLKKQLAALRAGLERITTDRS